MAVYDDDAGILIHVDFIHIESRSLHPCTTRWLFTM